VSSDARRGSELQAEADAVVAQFIADRSPGDAAWALAVLATRVASRLHGQARAEATEHKNEPEWPAWAQLQNAARSLVLQASTCRDLAGRIGAPRG
jgi:hypothetical protein